MANNFNREKFFAAYRKQFGDLSQQQVNGLSRLLNGIENDPHIPAALVGIRWAAYMFATVKRETANTFTPIHEYGAHSYFVKRYGGQTRKGKELGNETPEEGYFYRGGGDVQTTGESNYEKAENALRREYQKLVADFETRTGRTFDLTVGDQANDEADPNNILDPAISYAVMSFGMRTGMFTGKKLADYISSRSCDYKGARRIINGTDHAAAIANDAMKFEAILKASKEAEPALTEDKPTVDPSDLNTNQKNQPEIPSEIIPGDHSPASENPSTAQPLSTDGDSVKVTNGLMSKVMAMLGGPIAVLTAIWGFISNHENLIFLGIACGTLIVLAIVFRQVILDYVRMQLHSDPDKYNVR